MTSFKQKDSVKVDCLYTEQFIDKSTQILYILEQDGREKLS